MKYKIILLILVTTFFIANVPVFGEEFTVTTDKNTYEDGDIIVISGNVGIVILEDHVTISIFRETDLVYIEQLVVAQDGGYTLTISAQGPQWKKEGQYSIRASYAGTIIEENFQFLLKKAIPVTEDIFEVDAGSSGTFDVEYSIRGGNIEDMLVDPDKFTLIIIIETTEDGVISLDLPRKSIDAVKSDGKDDVYIILIDGIEVPYQEVLTSTNSRVITIEFEEGDSDIEIIGTFVVPEFGMITVMILVVALVLTIVISTKNVGLAKHM